MGASSTSTGRTMGATYRHRHDILSTSRHRVNTLPRTIGRYEVTALLGQGAMGIVYLGRDPLLHRTVAIKVLTIYNDEFRRRFEREARTIAKLNHVNVVAIYDVGEDHGRPFLAMEFVEGETLRALIDRRAPLSLHSKLEIVIALCAGLGYAHRTGIMHRDIKPANVMITDEGVVKLLDFGLARMLDEESGSDLTRVGALLGTPSYMSPEQVQGLPLDRRSDVFAVGALMYELLSYRKPYGEDGPHVILHRIVHTDPPPLTDVCAIDPMVSSIVARAMDRRPDRRYATLEDLSAACAGAITAVGASAVEEPAFPVENAAPFVDEWRDRIEVDVQPQEIVQPWIEAPQQASGARRRWVLITGVLAVSAAALFTWAIPSADHDTGYSEQSARRSSSPPVETSAPAAAERPDEASVTEPKVAMSPRANRIENGRSTASPTSVDGSIRLTPQERGRGRQADEIRPPAGEMPPPPPPPPPAAPVRIGGDIAEPTKLRDVRPVYPPIAQSARVSGIVIIEATIGRDGNVTETKVLRSIPLLDQAAVDAVRQWQFTPTLLNGVPVPVIMTVTVNFTLQ